MEPSNQAGVPQSSSVQYRNLVSLIKKEVEDTIDSQLELSNTRRKLLVKRGKVRTFSRNVQLKRVDAGDAEAVFMDRLREYLNENQERLPTKLVDAYDRVEQTRNDLGEIEENYLQAERDLTGAEWKFSDEENEFYQFDHLGRMLEECDDDIRPTQSGPQTILPPPPPLNTVLPFVPDGRRPEDLVSLPLPPRPLPLSVAPTPDEDTQLWDIAHQSHFKIVTEINALRRDLNGLRYKQAECINEGDGGDLLLNENPAAYSDLPPFAHQYFRILAEIRSREEEAQWLRIKSEDLKFATPTTTRGCSDPAHCLQRGTTLSAPIIHANSESAAAIAVEDELNREKIDDWLLADLKDNAMQKTLYLSTLKDYGVPAAKDMSWEDQATQYWSYESSSGSENGSQSHLTTTQNTSQQVSVNSDDMFRTQRRERDSASSHFIQVDGSRTDHAGSDLKQTGSSKGSLIDDPCELPLPLSPSDESDCTLNHHACIPSIIVTASDGVRHERDADIGTSLSSKPAVVPQFLPESSSACIASRPKDSCFGSDISTQCPHGVGADNGKFPHQFTIQEMQIEEPSPASFSTCGPESDASTEGTTTRVEGSSHLTDAQSHSTVEVNNTPESNITLASQDAGSFVQPVCRTNCDSPLLHSIGIKVTPRPRTPPAYGIQPSNRQRIKDLIHRTRRGRSRSTSFMSGEYTIQRIAPSSQQATQEIAFFDGP